MSDALLGILAAGGTGFVSALVAWIFARRKNAAEARQAEAQADITELDRVEQAIKIWREMAEDLKAQVQTLSNENKSLICELKKVRKTNEMIITALKSITPENVHKVVDELQKSIESEK